MWNSFQFFSFFVVIRLEIFKSGIWWFSMYFTESFLRLDNFKFLLKIKYIVGDDGQKYFGDCCYTGSCGSCSSCSGQLDLQQEEFYPNLGDQVCLRPLGHWDPFSSFMFIPCDLIWTLRFCDHTWPSVPSCDLFWPHLTPCDLKLPHVTSCDPLWPLVTSFIPIWPSGTPYDIVSPSLIHCDLLWPPVIHCDLLWPMWPNMTSFVDPVWPY